MLVFESIHVGQVPCFAERRWCDPLWSSRVLEKTMSLSDLSDPKRTYPHIYLCIYMCIPYIIPTCLNNIFPELRGATDLFHHVLLFPQLRRLPSNWRKPWVLRCVATISTTTPFQVPLGFRQKCFISFLVHKINYIKHNSISFAS